MYEASATLPLEDALRSETDNLRHLLQLLQSQRAAVATSDVDAINDNIFVMHRLLHTLGEARRHRRLLVERLGASPDLAPQWGDDRDAELGFPPPWAAAPLQALRDELQLLAQAVAREVETNRQILRGVVAAGEELIRVLAGAEAPLINARGSALGAMTAGAAGPGMLNGSEGALINRTI